MQQILIINLFLSFFFSLISNTTFHTTKIQTLFKSAWLKNWDKVKENQKEISVKPNRKKVLLK